MPGTKCFCIKKEIKIVDIVISIMETFKSLVAIENIAPSKIPGQLSLVMKSSQRWPIEGENLKRHLGDLMTHIT